jgi:DNA-binding CsgD family transcriptional regulator
MQDGYKRAFEIAAAAGEAATPAEFGAFTMPQMTAWLGARDAVLVRLGADDCEIIAAGTEELERFGKEQFATRYYKHDLVVAAELASPSPVVRTSLLVDFPSYRETELYRRLYADNEITTPLFCRLTPHGAAIAALVFMRAEGDSDFGESDETFCRQVCPALSASWRRICRAAQENRLARLIEELLVESDPRPRVVFDERGRTVWASRSAVALLGGSTPEGLDALGLVPTRHKPDATAVRRVTVARGEQRLWGTLYQRSICDAETTVLVIDDLSHPSPRLLALAIEAELTPAETRVLVGLSMGLSTRTIAESQFISTHTVYTHVKRLLAKFGAASREELLTLAEADRVAVGGVGARPR